MINRRQLLLPRRHQIQGALTNTPYSTPPNNSSFFSILQTHVSKAFSMIWRLVFPLQHQVSSSSEDERSISSTPFPSTFPVNKDIGIGAPTPGRFPTPAMRDLNRPRTNTQKLELEGSEDVFDEKSKIIPTYLPRSNKRPVRHQHLARDNQFLRKLDNDTNHRNKYHVSSIQDKYNEKTTVRMIEEMSIENEESMSQELNDTRNNKLAVKNEINLLIPARRLSDTILDLPPSSRFQIEKHDNQFIKVSSLDSNTRIPATSSSQNLRDSQAQNYKFSVLNETASSGNLNDKVEQGPINTQNPGVLVDSPLKHSSTAHANERCQGLGITNTKTNSENSFSNPPTENPFTKQSDGNPFTSQTVKNPFTKQSDGNPFTSQTVENPLAKQAVGNPFTSQAVENPFTKQSDGNPFTSQTTENPLAKQAVGNPFTSQTVENPLAKQAVGNPFTSQTVENPFTKQSDGNPFSTQTAENPFTKQVAENPFSTQTAENSFTKKAVENPFSTQTAENPFTKKAVENPFSTQTVENPFTKQVAENPFTTQAPENPVPEQSDKNPFVNQISRDSFSKQSPIQNFEGSYSKQVASNSPSRRATPEEAIKTVPSASSTPAPSRNDYLSINGQPNASSFGNAHEITEHSTASQEGGSQKVFQWAARPVPRVSRRGIRAKRPVRK